MTDVDVEAANRATEKVMAEREVELLQIELMQHVLEELERASRMVEVELRALHESLLQVAPIVAGFHRFNKAKLATALQPVGGYWGLSRTATQDVHEAFFRAHRQLLLNQAKTVEILKMTTQVANDLTAADFDASILTVAERAPAVQAKQKEIEARLKAATDGLNAISGSARNRR